MLKGVTSQEEIDKLMKIVTTEDSQECIIKAYILASTGLYRPVNVKYQLVMDHVLKGDEKVQYAPTDLMITDMFT